MAYTKTRRSALFAAAVTAVVLCLASVAFACSQHWTGQFELTGTGGAVTAIGSNAQMAYCAGWPKGTLKVDHAHDATLTASLGTAKSGCTAAGGFAAGNGGVALNLNVGDAFPTTLANGAWSLDTPNGDCMSTNTTVGTDQVYTNIAGVKTFVVAISTMWTITYKANMVPANAAGQADGICASERNAPDYAIEVPVVFV